MSSADDLFAVNRGIINRGEFTMANLGSSPAKKNVTRTSSPVPMLKGKIKAKMGKVAAFLFTSKLDVALAKREDREQVAINREVSKIHANADRMTDSLWREYDRKIDRSNDMAAKFSDVEGAMHFTTYWKAAGPRFAYYGKTPWGNFSFKANEKQTQAMEILFIYNEDYGKEPVTIARNVAKSRVNATCLKWLLKEILSENL